MDFYECCSTLLNTDLPILYGKPFWKIYLFERQRIEEKKNNKSAAKTARSDCD
jgi:hypothetical protein